LPLSTLLNLQKTRKRLKLLQHEVLMYQRVTEGLRGNLKIERLLRLIVDSVRQGMGFKRAGVFLVDPDGQGIRLGVGIDKTGRKYEHGRSSFPLTRVRGHDVFSDIVNGHRKYFLTNNLFKRFPGHIRRHERLILNNAAVPIQVRQGRPIGILVVDNLYVNRFITKSDISSLVNYSTQAGLAIESFRSHESILKQSVTDSLTGLYNRRFLEDAIVGELGRCQRYKRRCSLLMLDIDHFKRVNDTYGHASGDEILRQIAEILRENTRSLDVVTRFGGEEFAILLPETGAENVSVVARRILRVTRSMKPAVARMAGDGKRVTVSLGVACYIRGNVTVPQMVKKADLSLYQAKHRGRNRCGPLQTVSA
jgi:diguanylate cyclase (GGDEF)-like protein